MGFPARKSAKPYDRPARKVESTPVSPENEVAQSSPISSHGAEEEEEEEEEEEMTFDLYRVCVIADLPPAELREAFAQLKEKFDVIFDDCLDFGEEFSELNGDEDEDADADASTETSLVWSKLHQKNINRANICWVPVVISYEDAYTCQLHVYNKFVYLMEDIDEAICNTYGKEWRVLYDDIENMVCVRRLKNFPFHKSICHVNV